MTLTIELDREEDGRWIAEVLEISGVMAYGLTREDAVRAAEALTFRVLAEMLEKQPRPEPMNRIEFVPRAA